MKVRPIDGNELLKKFSYSSADTEDEQIFNSAARKIIREMPTLTPPDEWVSVEERMPTIEKTYGGYGTVSVNVFNGRCVQPMNYHQTIVRGKTIFRWEYPWGKIYDGSPITHWAPLPAPPTKV